MAKYVCLANDAYMCEGQCWCCIADSEDNPPTRCLYAGKKHRVPEWVMAEDDAGNPTDFVKYSADPGIRVSPSFASVKLFGKDFPLDKKTENF